MLKKTKSKSGYNNCIFIYLLKPTMHWNTLVHVVHFLYHKINVGYRLQRNVIECIVGKYIKITSYLANPHF